jgi:hypothetical protein
MAIVPRDSAHLQEEEDAAYATGFSKHRVALPLYDAADVFLVHGEPEACAGLARRLHQELGWTAVVPSYGERVRCD